MSLDSRSEDELEPLQWDEVVEFFRDIGAGAAIAFAILGGLFAACLFLAG